MYCDVCNRCVLWGLRGWSGGEGVGLGPGLELVLGSVGGGEGEPVVREAEFKGQWVVTAAGDPVGGGGGWLCGGPRPLQGGHRMDDAAGVAVCDDGDDDCGVEDEGDLWVV